MHMINDFRNITKLIFNLAMRKADKKNPDIKLFSTQKGQRVPFEVGENVKPK